MDVIEIGQSKLILILDRQDMEKYMIDTDAEALHLKNSLTRLVYDLSISPLFLSDVLVQIFDSKNGGCEMFVTKIPEDSGVLDSDSLSTQQYAYIFKDINDLVFACHMLSTKGKESAFAYVDTDRKDYYLVLDKEHSYLGEFNGKKCKDIVHGYIAEHCKLITNNAIETLARLF